jgi:hypothetical protein
MSWSATVTDPETYKNFDLQTVEKFNSENSAYPFDANLALEVAQRLGLKSATISGGRTPTPGSNDEVVVVCITGTVDSTDFLETVKRAIMEGPDEGTPMFELYRALAILREFPCIHKLEPYEDHQRCTLCTVHYRDGMMWFDG